MLAWPLPPAPSPASDSMRRPRIVFASYALRGHINKCIALAAELAGRGHAVFFATQEAGRAWLTHPGIRHVAWEPRIPGGADGDFVARLIAVRGAMSEQPNEFHRLALGARAAAQVYLPAFDSLKAVLEPVAPDMLIVPQVLSPGIDLAHAMKWPLIIQATYLPPAVRLRPIPASDARPGAGWRRRLESIPWFLGHALALRRLDRARRARAGGAPLGELFRQASVVAMTDPSVEAGETFAPNVRLVGPAIPRPLPPLSAPTARWIEQHAAQGIVLVAFGTLVRLQAGQLAALAEGLAGCGAAVLWALPEAQHGLVRRYSASLRAETFVPQTAVLACPAVRAFVSHAGANSALEAMYWGRPILGLPFMFDQHYYARRAVDLSVGLQLDPHALTSDGIRGALGRLLHDRAFADAAGRLAARLQRTPGIRGAADIVEAELARRHAGA